MPDPQLPRPSSQQIPPKCYKYLRNLVTSQDLENPTGGGSHLGHLPSVPLTCSTVDQQEEQGQEQAEDPHGRCLSWVFSGLQRGHTENQARVKDLGESLFLEMPS